MTQIFADDGRVVPVTRVTAGPCVVTKVTPEKNGTQVEIGFGEKHRRSFHADAMPELSRGTELTVTTFAPGDIVQVTGISKGKGFQGVVKRHHFHGHPTTHGHKDQERMPGSIGTTGPERVFKGKRMAGRMGTDQVTVKNLEIVSVNAEKNELLIKGALPGAIGGVVIIQAPGALSFSVAPVSVAPVA